MQRIVNCLFGTAFLLAAPAAGVPSDIHEAPSIHFDTPPVVRAAVPTPRALVDPIAQQAFVPVRQLDRLDPGRIEVARLQEMLDPNPVARVGFVREVPDFGLTLDDATVTDLADGRVLWSLAVRTPDARATRLHFVDTHLDGAIMTVHSTVDGRTYARGPYSGAGPRGDGDFWASSLPGDTVHVEVVGPADALPMLRIAEIVHFHVDPSPDGQTEGGSNDGDIFDCHLDAACVTLNASAKAATGQMNYIAGGEARVCTGTLLNDLDPDTAVPYFITAAHCVNTQAEVNTLEVVWNWERSTCNGGLPDYNSLPRNEGGTLLVTYSENDMSFIRLNGGVMTNGMAGWTTETSLDNAQGIHHPHGSYKRAIFVDSVGACPGCVCLDGDDFDYYDVDAGLTEKGSSGSGVFNSAGQFSGQLFGICSDFSDPDDMDCTNIDSYWRMYGEFESTFEYTNVPFWLNLGGTIHVNPDHPFPCHNGTDECPFETVAEGHAAAWPGARLLLYANSYPEAVTLNKPIDIDTVGGTVTIGQ